MKWLGIRPNYNLTNGFPRKECQFVKRVSFTINWHVNYVSEILSWIMNKFRWYLMSFFSNCALVWGMFRVHPCIGCMPKSCLPYLQCKGLKFSPSFKSIWWWQNSYLAKWVHYRSILYCYEYPKINHIFTFIIQSDDLLLQQH